MCTCEWSMACYTACMVFGSVSSQTMRRSSWLCLCSISPYSNELAIRPKDHLSALKDSYKIFFLHINNNICQPFAFASAPVHFSYMTLLSTTWCYYYSCDYKLKLRSCMQLLLYSNHINYIYIYIYMQN